MTLQGDSAQVGPPEVHPVAMQVWPGAQSELSGVCVQLPAGSVHASTVQGMPSSHPTAVPRMQVLPMQSSLPLHAEESWQSGLLEHVLGSAVSGREASGRAPSRGTSVSEPASRTVDTSG